MKVVFHERFYEVYASDPAAAAGRMEAIVKALGNDFEWVRPSRAPEEDLVRVHSREHMERIKGSKDLWEMASLAAGAAILAAELGCRGEPAFGLIRPPGHHASPDSCWGFCYFNNIAIAIRKLMKTGQIAKALVFDFDLHFGDGTEAALGGFPEVAYFHPEGSNRAEFMAKVQKRLERAEGIDLLAVSAGFDRHVEDWGGLLTTDDYRTLGFWVKANSQKFCRGRRFAVLEGGYNHAVLGQNVRAFLEGMN